DKTAFKIDKPGIAGACLVPIGTVFHEIESEIEVDVRSGDWVALGSPAGPHSQKLPGSGTQRRGRCPARTCCRGRQGNRQRRQEPKTWWRRVHRQLGKRDRQQHLTKPSLQLWVVTVWALQYEMIDVGRLGPSTKRKQVSFIKPVEKRVYRCQRDIFFFSLR